MASSSGWSSLEVAMLDGEKKFKSAPVSEELAKSGRLDSRAIKLMKLIEERGWCEATASLRDSKGERLIVPKQVPIWLLKCKPSCWRLYFYVDEPRKTITYLRAVCKKERQEDPEDTAKAKRIFNKLACGSCAVRLFSFPTE